VFEAESGESGVVRMGYYLCIALDYLFIIYIYLSPPLPLLSLIEAYNKHFFGGGESGVW